MITTFINRCSFTCIALILAGGLFGADAIGKDEQAFILKNLTQQERDTFQSTMSNYQHIDQRMSFAEGRIQAGLQAAKALQVARGVAMPTAAKPPANAEGAPAALSDEEIKFVTENMNDREQEAANNAMIAYVRDHGRDDRAAMQQAMAHAARKLQIARGVDIKGSELTADPNTLPNLNLSADEIDFISKNTSKEEGELYKAIMVKQVAAAGNKDPNPDAMQRAFAAVKKRQVARGVVMPGASKTVEPAAVQAAAPLANPDAAAQVEAFKAEVVKLDAVNVAYKKTLIDAAITANDQHIAFLATLDLRDLSDAIPADPKRSDLQRRDKVQTFNQILAMAREKVADWKAEQESPQRKEMKRKTLMTLTELPTDARRAVFTQDLLDLYISLKLEAQVPVAKPVDEPGASDNAPWRKKK